MMMTLNKSLLGVALACTLMSTQAMAQEAPQSAPKAKPSRTAMIGRFDAKSAIKGQKHIDRAMTLTMDELAKKALLLDAEYMYAYGLGLELGRKPAVLDKGDQDRFQTAFSKVMDLYLTSRDKVNLTGREDALLKEPEFWLLIARHLGRRKLEQAPLNIAAPTDGSPMGGGMNSMTLSSFLTEPEDSEDRAFNLNQEVVLPRSVTFAAEACVKYGRAKAQMISVQKVEIAQTPYLTAERLSELKATAQTVENTADANGPDACGGKEFYAKVYNFAGQYIGKLGFPASSAQ
jgi:hypothetical protein